MPPIQWSSTGSGSKQPRGHATHSIEQHRLLDDDLAHVRRQGVEVKREGTLPWDPSGCVHPRLVAPNDQAAPAQSQRAHPLTHRGLLFELLIHPAPHSPTVLAARTTPLVVSGRQDLLAKQASTGASTGARRRHGVVVDTPPQVTTTGARRRHGVLGNELAAAWSILGWAHDVYLRTYGDSRGLARRASSAEYTGIHTYVPRYDTTENLARLHTYEDSHKGGKTNNIWRIMHMRTCICTYIRTCVCKKTPMAWQDAQAHEYASWCKQQRHSHNHPSIHRSTEATTNQLKAGHAADQVNARRSSRGHNDAIPGALVPEVPKLDGLQVGLLAV